MDRSAYVGFALGLAAIVLLVTHQRCGRMAVASAALLLASFRRPAPTCAHGARYIRMQTSRAVRSSGDAMAPRYPARAVRDLPHCGACLCRDRLRSRTSVRREGAVASRRKATSDARSSLGSCRFLLEEPKCDADLFLVRLPGFGLRQLSPVEGLDRFHGEGCSGSPKCSTLKAKVRVSALTMTLSKDPYRSGKKSANTVAVIEAAAAPRRRRFRTEFGHL